MAVWANPSLLGVFVLGVALLLVGATGGVVSLLGIIRLRGNLTPRALAASALLGVLCIIISFTGLPHIVIESPPTTAPTPTPAVAESPEMPSRPSQPTDTKSIPPTTTESSPPPPEPPAKASESADGNSTDSGSTLYLQDAKRIGSPNALNSNPGLEIGSNSYPHSVAVGCTSEDGLVAFDVAGYSSLHAVIGFGNDQSGAGITEDIASEITISNNIGKVPLKVVTIKPSDGVRILDVSLKGVNQMKISCVPTRKTRAGNGVFYEVGFGNAELKK
ncbi:hypothetical protein ACIRSS_23100 [Amycolatopsis sp. NPDC101161]|uniref:hypothetical protein n=1 Tax=Amycolatopsis sp. NPDC101161 TaxID=3363940 RepID=UPI0038092BE5